MVSAGLGLWFSGLVCSLGWGVLLEGVSLVGCVFLCLSFGLLVLVGLCGLA